LKEIQDKDALAFETYEPTKGKAYLKWEEQYPDRIQWDEYVQYYDPNSIGVPQEDKFYVGDIYHDDSGFKVSLGVEPMNLSSRNEYQVLPFNQPLSKYDHRW